MEEKGHRPGATVWMGDVPTSTPSLQQVLSACVPGFQTSKSNRAEGRMGRKKRRVPTRRPSAAVRQGRDSMLWLLGRPMKREAAAAAGAAMGPDELVESWGGPKTGEKQK